MVIYMGLSLRRIESSDMYNSEIFNMLKLMPKEENGFHNPGFGITWEDFPDFITKSLIEITNPDTSKGLVPQTIFWLYEEDKPIGISKMRHYLTEKLKIRGGHIGYGILKGKRNKGYGKILLNKTLQEIKKIGVDRVLITCDEHNNSSRKVIESNNGKLEDIVDNECRYWIEV